MSSTASILADELPPHAFWQELESGPAAHSGVYRSSYPAQLPDGRVLRLPIRALPDGVHGVASLIINQASFAVLDVLAAALAARLQMFEPDVVVGLPTLGLTLSAAVAAKLGHSRHVPCGTSRKFWYSEALSVPIASITTETVRHLYLDPRLLPMLEGKRVVLVDDVISTGRSILAGVHLLAQAGVEPVAIGAAMLQSTVWEGVLGSPGAGLRERVHGVFSTPRLVRTADLGWRPE